MRTFDVFVKDNQAIAIDNKLCSFKLVREVLLKEGFVNAANNIKSTDEKTAIEVLNSENLLCLEEYSKDNLLYSIIGSLFR